MERKYKIEEIFSVACEGFGADYFRITYDDGYVRFAREAGSSFDWDEMDMSESEYHKIYSSFVIYDSFEECWNECVGWPEWFCLAYLNMHEDYKEIIVEQVYAARKEASKTVRNFSCDDVERIIKQRMSTCGKTLPSNVYEENRKKTKSRRRDKSEELFFL